MPSVRNAPVGRLAFGEMVVAQLLDQFGPTGAVRRDILAGRLQHFLFDAGRDLGELPIIRIISSKREQMILHSLVLPFKTPDVRGLKHLLLRADAQGQHDLSFGDWMNSTGTKSDLPFGSR